MCGCIVADDDDIYLCNKLNDFEGTRATSTSWMTVQTWSVGVLSIDGPLDLFAFIAALRGVCANDWFRIAVT